MKEFIINNRVAAIYIILITVSWCILYWKYLKLRDISKKNKSHYDLLDCRFELEPGEESNKFNIYCGKLLRSYEFTDSDYELDRHLFFKMFIGWLEEDYKKDGNKG